MVMIMMIMTMVSWWRYHIICLQIRWSRMHGSLSNGAKHQEGSEHVIHNISRWNLLIFSCHILYFFLYLFHISFIFVIHNISFEVWNLIILVSYVFIHIYFIFSFVFVLTLVILCELLTHQKTLLGWPSVWW